MLDAKKKTITLGKLGESKEMEFQDAGQLYKVDKNKILHDTREFKYPITCAGPQGQFYE